MFFCCSVCGPPDVEFSPHQPFAVTAGVGGTDARAAADMLSATDCQGQMKGSRSSLPGGVASGAFPWRVQGQQLTSAELLAAFKQDQRALSNCFSYDGVSGQGTVPQTRSGAASDLNHHAPYSSCSAQQGVTKGGSNLDSFVSHQAQQVGASRGTGFSGVARKEEERGKLPRSFAFFRSRWRRGEHPPTVNRVRTYVEMPIGVDVLRWWISLCSFF